MTGIAQSKAQALSWPQHDSSSTGQSACMAVMTAWSKRGILSIRCCRPCAKNQDYPGTTARVRSGVVSPHIRYLDLPVLQCTQDTGNQDSRHCLSVSGLSGVPRADLINANRPSATGPFRGSKRPVAVQVIPVVHQCRFYTVRKRNSISRPASFTAQAWLQLPTRI
jgi:hypothetical protein